MCESLFVVHKGNYTLIKVVDTLQCSSCDCYYTCRKKKGRYTGYAFFFQKEIVPLQSQLR
ncbi:hypothetical protein HMPREF1869_01313 [Bacteroidales bacterium KA00251]|nr:hypothetical protein HMPREF1869_01313 [Bacteroidales bacterium KA00251]